MTEVPEPSRHQSTWQIIAAVVIAVSSLLCCGCLAVAWFLGDTVLKVIEQFSTSIQLLPL